MRRSRLFWAQPFPDQLRSYQTHSNRPCSVTFLGTWICLATLLLVPSLHASEAPVPIEGWLTVTWADAQPGAEAVSHHEVLLTDDHGRNIPLAMSEALLWRTVSRWNGQRVKVYPAAVETLIKEPTETVLLGFEARKPDELRVAAIELASSTQSSSMQSSSATPSSSSSPSSSHFGTSAPVSGGQPWISLLCKFSDVSAEPRNLSFFQGMYDNSPGRLDHYWREVSDGQINIVGSIAVDWVTLPGTQASYVPSPGSGTNADRTQIFQDCTAAVDARVDFSRGGAPFAGINLMINDVLDCCAWGGGRFATLDGVSKVWRTTWNPPWAFQTEAVIAHEMGHGFGLPHANNWDGDDNPYDSPWDVMSSASSYSTRDPSYGSLGKHVNAYHKDRLGWFPAAQRFETPNNSSTSIELDHTALNGGTNYKIAIIPINAERWYTVEARVRSGDYESSLAGDAVIIHEVLLNRSEPSWAVDADDPPAGFGDNPGTMWTVGETFEDSENRISITVDYSTATGFGVTITSGLSGFFVDDFEAGNLALWTISVP